MFEILTFILFVWLMVNAISLAFKISWGAAKILASILMVVALPLLIVCGLFIGGVALVVPVVLVGIAVGILKACV